MPETLTTESAHCRLTLTATTEAAHTLHLNCGVVNTSATVLYLCDQLYPLPQPYSSSGEPVLEPAPDLVHIQVEAQGVHLDKAIMDMSFHKGIRGLDIPLLTRLEPGQERAHAIRLSLPLMPYRVLDLFPGEAPPALLPMRFSLGYLVWSAQMAAHITEVSTPQGPALRMALFLSNHQHTITTGPFRQPVPVANAVGNASPKPVPATAWTPWGP